MFVAVMTFRFGRGSTLAKDWTTRTCAASQILTGRFSRSLDLCLSADLRSVETF